MNLLFDANTLLNGILLPYSRSRSVVDRLWKGSYQGAVCQDTLDEALGAIQRAHRNTGVDLSGAFNNAVVRLPLTILPSVPPEQRSLYQLINGSGDRAVVTTAKEYGLTIFTTDVKDFRHAGQYGVPVITPEQLPNEGGPSLENIALGNLAWEAQGTIYMVVEPNWVGLGIDRSIDKRFYFFDSAGVGGLWYDNALRSLVYESDLGPRAVLETGRMGHESLPLHVSVTYHCDKGVSLFFGYRGKKAGCEAKWVPKPILPGTPTFVASDRYGQNQINGLVYRFTSLPTDLSEKGMNNLMSGQTSAHPWERLSVEQMIFYLFGIKTF